jgi:hypothetical protein
LIVLGRKYIFWRFLCDGGCVCNRLGMGPGLGCISPHNMRRVGVWLWSFVGMLGLGVGGYVGVVGI